MTGLSSLSGSVLPRPHLGTHPSDHALQGVTHFGFLQPSPSPFVFLFPLSRSLFFFFLSFLGLLPWYMEVPRLGGLIGAVAAGLHHSNTGSEPRLRPTPQLTAMPGP